MTVQQYEINQLKNLWQESRWQGIKRDYAAEDVYRLQGSVHVENTISRLMAEELWYLLNNRPFVRTGGVLTGDMAVQVVRAGWPALYCSGWQIAADANTNKKTYPDQSLYSPDSGPWLVERFYNALLRQDEIQHDKNIRAMMHQVGNVNMALLEKDRKQRETGRGDIKWLVPVIADAEAGFGGVLNVFELMKAMIASGAAGVHFEDQLSSEKKCGHLGGKVVIPTSEFVKKLKAARFAADVMGVPTILIARTDADSAKLLANDIDERDRPFIIGKRNSAGFFKFKGGLDAAIERGLTYAPYADMLWCETSNPNLDEARVFANAIHSEFPGKILAYNCSPSFRWKKFLSEQEIAEFQDKLGEMGYKFQFITLFGFHLLNYYTFMIARDYTHRGMSAFVDLQEAEFQAERLGYTAHRHQEEVGTGYFDEVQLAITGEDTETVALKGSTEEEQFKK